MDALGNGGGFWWGWGISPIPNSRSRPRRHPNSSGSTDRAGGSGGGGVGFPLKPAVTAASLALAGDTIAQVRDRMRNQKDLTAAVLEGHDFLRALRMASYGFLLYGPGSYAWYQFLDRRMPDPTLLNFSLKVLLNQIVLGPCVIAVVFAWNNLWQRKLSELPEKYRKDALPTLLYGFRFWIPVSILNFGLIPLQARVAFMSTCAIFWNFYLSSTMSK